MLTVERFVLGTALAGRDAGVGVADLATVQAALAPRPGLPPEQVTMVRRLTTGGDLVKVVGGKAGSGKSGDQLYREAGYVAPSRGRTHNAVYLADQSTNLARCAEVTHSPPREGSDRRDPVPRSPGRSTPAEPRPGPAGQDWSLRRGGLNAGRPPRRCADYLRVTSFHMPMSACGMPVWSSGQ